MDKLYNIMDINKDRCFGIFVFIHGSALKRVLNSACHMSIIKMIDLEIHPVSWICPQVRCVRFKNVPEGYTSSLMREELEAPRVGVGTAWAEFF